MECDLIIRDVIYSDIVIPYRFVKLIDTKEFQRLRRIRQLASADLVFPSANHNRFAHSVGTFYIMNKMVTHFKKQFENLGIEIAEDEWDALLAAALLHDIGHGPFSHAFEKVTLTNFSHEAWTRKIISDSESDVYKVLSNFYDDEDLNKLFADKVIAYIDEKVSAKNTTNKETLFSNAGKLDMHYVFKSLVSSQLDADRIDYILRDSYHTGFKFGFVDVDKLIDGMYLGVSDKDTTESQYCLTVLESHVPFLESYLLARFQMYKNVYMQNFKLYTECIYILILERACKICRDDEEDKLNRKTPQTLINIFNGKPMNINLFIKLDDYMMMGAIRTWSEYTDDRILSGLCKIIIDRTGFLQQDVSKECGNTSNYEDDFVLSMIRFIPNIKEVLKYYVISAHEKFSLYNRANSIWVLCQNGKISELSKVSIIIDQNKEGIFFPGSKDILYVNTALLLDGLSVINKKQCEKEIVKLDRRYNSRNHIEIEQKFTVSNESQLKEAKIHLGLDNSACADDALLGKDYQVTEKGCHEQIDTYYDIKIGEKWLLYNNESTLRVRQRRIDSGKEEYIVTMKFPVPSSSKQGQSNRFEDEYTSKSNSLDGFHEIIQEQIKIRNPLLASHIPFMAQFIPAIQIVNQRESVQIKKGAFEAEIAFDNYKVKNLINSSVPDLQRFQIEVELKSDYLQRVNLKLFADKMKKQIPYLKVNKESKYKNAMRIFSKQGQK